MPNQIVDQRDKTQVYESGSDLFQIYVDATAAAALPVWAASGTGWYTLGYLQGGTWGPEREIEEIKSEAGVKIRDRVTDNKFVFANGSLQTDDETLGALEYFEDNSFKARYQGATLPSTPNTYQILGLYSCLIRKENWTIETSEGALHVRNFTVDATEDTDGNLKVIETVSSITDESGWPSTLDAFLTDESAWPT